MVLRLHILIFAALNCLLAVRGQTTHIVHVGQKGSFFDPPTTSAGPNDTVTFLFDGFIHTVTQSSLENPCLPLPGGFSSGPAGKLDNGSEPSQTWDLHIANASQPIYFFCELSQPFSHCGSGMVGAINPPSIQVYDQLRSSVLANPPNTPVPSLTPALTGIGAFATQTPAIPLTSVSIPPSSSATPSSDSASTITVTPTPPPVPASSSGKSPSHLGAIVGGAVGGAVVIVLLIAVLLWFHRQRQLKEIPTSPLTDDSDFFRYNPGPARRPSEAFVEAKHLENLSTPALSQISPLRSRSPDPPLSPNRRRGQNPPFPPGVPQIVVQPLATPQQQYERSGFERQTSYGSLTSAPGGAPDQINIQALASEVAVLLRNPSASTGQSTLTIPEGPRPLNKNLESRSRDPINRNDSPMGPPAYRAMGGTPASDRTGSNR
ncbi:hypothetical protein GALMADRAFT_1296964 [Galerina marginata CBS 339.88]|uniref:Phytocyanin domain-containing protein n=1 Tax=Galerina marginata (strain CBS 339.88) TaxID=685588 RepID=A0A067TGC6_GALM3|nr:hypothetical protein GALMADRAFT_1296964 [Galerina marginata CBS 339.88]